MSRLFTFTCCACLLVVSLAFADIAPPTKKHLAFIGVEKYPDYEFYVSFTYWTRFNDGKQWVSQDNDHIEKIVDSKPMFIQNFQRASDFRLIAVPKNVIEEKRKEQTKSVPLSAKSQYSHIPGQDIEDPNEHFRYKVSINDGQLFAQPLKEGERVDEATGEIEKQGMTSRQLSTWIAGILIPMALLLLGIWIVRFRKQKSQSPTPNPS